MLIIAKRGCLHAGCSVVFLHTLCSHRPRTTANSTYCCVHTYHNHTLVMFHLSHIHVVNVFFFLQFCKQWEINTRKMEIRLCQSHRYKKYKLQVPCSLFLWENLRLYCEEKAFSETHRYSKISLWPISGICGLHHSLPWGLMVCVLRDSVNPFIKVMFIGKRGEWVMFG